MSDWTKVSERLPKVNQSVLAVRLGNVCNLFLHYNGMWKTDGYCVKQHAGFDDVTHWMPLPQPPEDV